jgi:hypothetical protein
VAGAGIVVPHIGETVDSTVEGISAGPQSPKAGGVLGKVAVIVDRDLAQRPTDDVGRRNDR